MRVFLFKNIIIVVIKTAKTIIFGFNLKSVFKMQKSNLRVIQSISSTILIIMLLAAVVSYNGKLFGKKTSQLFKAEKSIQLPLEQLKDSGYDDYNIDKVSDGIWRLINQQGNKEGYVITSIVFSKSVYGYAGNIPMLIFIDKQNNIEKIHLLPNYETPRFLCNVIDNGIVKQWIGKSVEEALDDKKPEFVSGATMSSDAINISVRRSLLAFQNVNESAFSAFKEWNIKTIAAILVILSALFMAFYRKNKTLRTFQMVLNTIVLGFYCGQFISISLIVGWLGSGVNLIAKASLALMVVLALIMPMFFNKKQFYCLWICPFGSAQELAGRITKTKWKIPSEILKYLRHARKAILILLFASMWVGVGFDLVNYEPFAAFLLGHAGIAVTIIAIISIILSLFVDRPWCRFCCPTGQLLRWAQNLVKSK